jgi:hypothetical protein
MRDRPAANIMIGPFEAEVCMFAETANRLGAVQIGGSAQTWQFRLGLASWTIAYSVKRCMPLERIYQQNLASRVLS